LRHQPSTECSITVPPFRSNRPSRLQGATVRFVLASQDFLRVPHPPQCVFCSPCPVEYIFAPFNQEWSHVTHSLFLVPFFFLRPSLHVERLFLLPLLFLSLLGCIRATFPFRPLSASEFSPSIFLIFFSTSPKSVSFLGIPSPPATAPLRVCLGTTSASSSPPTGVPAFSPPSVFRVEVQRLTMFLLWSSSRALILPL